MSRPDERVSRVELQRSGARMVVGVLPCWGAHFLPALLDDDTQVCSLLTCSFVRVGQCSRVCTVPVWAADHD